MRLNNIQFAEEFNGLCACFMRKVEKNTLEQWWAKLKHLSHLKEAMKRACLADRFPSVSQVISYNYDFANSTKRYKPNNTSAKKSDYIFVLDLIMEYGKDPDFVWGLVDNKHLKIPRGYSDLRRDEGRQPKDTIALFLSEKYLESIPEMHRAKEVEGFVTLGRAIKK